VAVSNLDAVISKREPPRHAMAEMSALC